MKFNPYKTIENVAVAEFTDGGDDKPVEELKVAIVAVQEGNGDPSPENVRAISGFTEANVIVAAENIATELVQGGINSSTGEDTTQSSTYRLRSSYMNVSYGMSMKIFWKSNVVKYFRAYFYTDSEYINATSWLSNNVSVTIPEIATRLRIMLSASEGGTATEITPTDVSNLVVADIADETSISFPEDAGTVYEGILNVTTGELTITHSEITLPDVNEIIDSSLAGSTGKYVGYTLLPNGVYDSNFLAEKITRVAYESRGAAWKGSITSAENRIVVFVPTDATVESVNEALSGSKLVYKLKTTQTIRLTPTQVKTILGDNTIWADTGNILKLTYIYHFIQLKEDSDSMKSGYVMIDCGGLDLTGGSTPQTLDGLYDRCQEAIATGKLALAENCINGTGIPVSPLPVGIYNATSTKTAMLVGTLLIEITNEDSVTITDLTD